MGVATCGGRGRGCGHRRAKSVSWRMVEVWDGCGYVCWVGWLLRKSVWSICMSSSGVGGCGLESTSHL